MDITIGITIPDGLQGHDIKRCEELLVHTLVADNGFVMSAVVMRAEGSIGVAYFPDENTRQSR